jgi:hypothetical protein
MMYRSLGMLAALLLLSGCAALSSLDNSVSSYGEWPADRAPGSYSFERLPSQRVNEQQQVLLEDAARPALEKAGFRPAASAGAADVTVQVGARVSRADPSPWDDPFFWRFGGGYRGYPGWYGPGLYGSGFYGSGFYGSGFGGWPSSPSYEREVAMLIRDRASGSPLYEARAITEGGYGGDQTVVRAMFEAALADFPKPALSPRSVRVQLP